MPVAATAVRPERSTDRFEPDDAFRAPSITDADLASLLADPALPSCVSRLIDELTDIHDGHPLLNRLLCDRGRVMLGLFVAYLDVVPQPGHRPGVTLGAIQSLCRTTRLCSPGRAAAVIAAMRFAGYIVSEVDPSDHRRRRLAPSSRLKDEQSRRWRLHYVAMSEILARAAEILPRIGEPSFSTELLRALGARYLAGFRVLDHAPVLAPFAESNAGLLIVAGLAARQMRSGDSAPLPISISATARQFGVARSHVRQILRAAERAGLLVRSPLDSTIIVLPTLRQAVLRFFATVFLLLDQSGAEALARTCGSGRDASG